MKKTIAIIYGGRGRERNISVLSAEWLCSTLDKSKYNVIPIYISERGHWYISENAPFSKMPITGARPTHPINLHGNCGFLSGDGIISVDVAIPILHGDFGEDGGVQGALETALIPFVGSGVTASAVCIDKAYTKAVATALGIRTARWITHKKGSSLSPIEAMRLAEEAIGYPMFIKPARLGSSIGASAVRAQDDFAGAYVNAARYDGRVLIEELIPVKYEVECAFLGYGESRRFLAGGLIKTFGTPYGYDEKYCNTGVCEALHGVGIVPEREEIEKAARRLCEELSLRHFARLDFFVGYDGQIYFNEVNTIPGMTKSSLYPLLTEDMGLARGEFIELLIEDAAK